MTAIHLRRKLASGLASALTVSVLVLGSAVAGDGHGHTHVAMEQKVAAIIVANAVSPAAAPGIKTSAVYLQLENASGSAIDLVAVESPAFAMAHLHKTAMADGLMTMEPVAQLAIPGGESVTFAPGGLHIMLMGAGKTFKPGDSFPLTLVFGSGDALEIAVSVTAPGDMPSVGQDHSSMKMN